MLSMNLANVVLFFWTAIYFYKSSAPGVANNKRYSFIPKVLPLIQRLYQSVELFLINSFFFHPNVYRLSRFRVIFSLFFLMGVSWMTEAISFLIHGDFTHWVFVDVVNILTGLFVFIIFVCKPKVWKLLKLRVSTFFATPTCRRILPCVTPSAKSNGVVLPVVDSRTKTGCSNREYQRQLTKETNLISQSP